MSVICAIHCAVLPVLLALFPTLLALPVDDHHFHQLMVWLVLPSSIVAVSLGCKQHQDSFVLIGAALGLLILVLTAFFGHDVLGEVGEKVATLVGAIILAAVHWRNYSLCRQDCCEHEHQH